MTCPFHHRLCAKGRGCPVCRAYFPDKQRHITDATLPICTGENYAKECLIYPEAVKWREKRYKDSLKLHCPFASNTVCGHPEEWWCKGGYYPHKLYPAYLEETRWQQWKRRALIFMRLRKTVEHYEGRPVVYSTEQLRETCWSGDVEIYEACPAYKDGVKAREEYKRLNAEKP